MQYEEEYEIGKTQEFLVAYELILSNGVVASC